MEKKPGIKTSEFWFKLLALLVSAITASGMFTNEIIVQCFVIAGAVLAALGYGAGRSFVKASTAKAEAFKEIPKNPS